MFNQTQRHAGGVTQGTASERHARMLLVSAVRRGYAVEATPAGGALITWTRHLFGPDGFSVVRADRSISLVALTPVGPLTEVIRDDLALIAQERRARYASEGRRRVIGGLTWRIPAGATARLLDRGLVVEEEGLVRLALTARLGLLAQTHRTRTTEPEGWYRPSAGDPYGSAGLNRPGGRAGMRRDNTSSADCKCGALSAVCGDRTEARRMADRHRREVAARFVTDQLIPPTGATA